MPSPRKPPAWSAKRDQWVAEFAGAALQLRPEMGLRFLAAVALSKYVSSSHLVPAEAAREWLATWQG